MHPFRAEGHSRRSVRCAEFRQPGRESPKDGGQGPSKERGQAGKGPPLPGTTGELCAVPDAAASAAPEEASTPICATRFLRITSFCSTAAQWLRHPRSHMGINDLLLSFGRPIHQWPTKVSPPASEAKAGPSRRRVCMVSFQGTCLARVSWVL